MPVKVEQINEYLFSDTVLLRQGYARLGLLVRYRFNVITCVVFSEHEPQPNRPTEKATDDYHYEKFKKYVRRF